MQKINFKNLPDTSTPLNASTLNQMQDNIENAIEDAEDTIPTVVDDRIQNKVHGDVVTDGSPVKCGYKVDNKDVYVLRKNGGYLPNTSAKTVDTGIIGGNLIDIKGQIMNANQTPIPYANPNSGVFGYYNPTTGMIQITTLSDRSTQNFYIDFYFTYGD